MCVCVLGGVEHNLDLLLYLNIHFQIQVSISNITLSKNILHLSKNILHGDNLSVNETITTKAINHIFKIIYNSQVVR